MDSKELASSTSDPLKDIEKMKKLIRDDTGYQLVSIFWKHKLEQAEKYLELKNKIK